RSSDLRRPVYGAKDSTHRSVYLSLPRGAAVPEMLSLFDLANPNLVVAQREVTTVPAQGLFLMNSPFVQEQAKQLAKRVLDTPNLDDAGRVDLACKITLGHAAGAAQRERVLKFLSASGSREAAWTAFCHTMYASAEFRYLD